MSAQGNLDGEPIRALQPPLRRAIEEKTLQAGQREPTTEREPLFSVILISYNMRREVARTLVSLTPDYQMDANADEYEVLVVENGSTEPLDERDVCSAGPNVSYHYVENTSPSPARAINYGAAQARGRVLGIMIDGACMLTPGVLRLAGLAYRAMENPVVMTRYFYLGPGVQNETIERGYSRDVEDQLLQQINWPQNGYRLFEIGTPLRIGEGRGMWFERMFESCCMFLTRTVFDDLGGCDERFDLPGGGFLAPDLYRRAALHPDAVVVQLVGEAVFHQLHGGTTTNTRATDREAKLKRFQREYRDLRGEDFSMPPGLPVSLGHLPQEAMGRYT